MTKTKTPASIKEYVSSLSEVKEVMRWVRKEVMNAQSRVHIWKMIPFSFCAILFQLLSSLGVGKILSGLIAKSRNEVVIGIISVAACLFIQKVFERRMAKAREWILSIHW